jgi:hypothetical protein
MDSHLLLTSLAIAGVMAIGLLRGNAMVFGASLVIAIVAAMAFYGMLVAFDVP